MLLFIKKQQIYAGFISYKYGKPAIALPAYLWKVKIIRGFINPQ